MLSRHRRHRRQPDGDAVRRNLDRNHRDGGLVAPPTLSAAATNATPLDLTRLNDGPGARRPTSERHGRTKPALALADSSRAHACRSAGHLRVIGMDKVDENSTPTRATQETAPQTRLPRCWPHGRVSQNDRGSVRRTGQTGDTPAHRMNSVPQAQPPASAPLAIESTRYPTTEAIVRPSRFVATLVRPAGLDLARKWTDMRPNESSCTLAQ